MRIKIISILLFVSLNVFGYILPYFQQQAIYSKETLSKKSYNKVSFVVNDEEVTIDKTSRKSENPLHYVLGNLFLYHNDSLKQFAKKHKISLSKNHYALFQDVPSVVYGSSEKTEYKLDGLKPEIWLNNEKAYPVKAVFALNGKLIVAEFNAFYSAKYKYMFPSQVTLYVDGEKTVYELTQFK